ncbi:MAG TPA: glycosyltransferase family 9 protein [Candidatus Competibacteraceae bacterium]|nr:glycosyltransferase family 9 protein [Candidatus Competibacteraceae bacterium]
MAVDLPADPAIRRILVLKWSAMGDVIIASALFEDIRRAFPDREIHLNTLPVWQPLFCDDARFDRVWAVDIRNRRHPLRAAGRWLWTVWRGHYDLIIDLQSNDRSRALVTLATWLGRVRWRIGNNRHFPYNIQPPPFPHDTHILMRMRAALNAAGIATATARPALTIPVRNRERAAALLRQHGLQTGCYALLFPGCNPAGQLKRWGAARYAELAWRLRAAGIARIGLIGGADEREECARIAAQCGDWLVNLCGQTEILDIPPLCERARLLVANDTGTAHLAAVTSTPMTVLCGPTDPRRVKPLGDNVDTLQAELPCVNCYRKQCLHHSCMALLSPERVMQHLYRRGLLQERGR